MHRCERYAAGWLNGNVIVEGDAVVYAQEGPDQAGDAGIIELRAEITT